MEQAQETKSPNIFNLFPHITEKGGECLMTTKVIYRKSTSGQLTTQGYAKAHPDEAADIHAEVMGSDHCPVSITLE